MIIIKLARILLCTCDIVIIVGESESEDNDIVIPSASK